MHLLKPQAGSESRRGKSSGHASDRTPDLVSHQKLHAPSSRTALGVRSSLEITKVMTLALGRAGRAGHLLLALWFKVSLHSQLQSECCWPEHEELTHQLTPCSAMAQSTPDTASHHTLQI